MREPLLAARAARALDQEAASSWGLSPFALVEAAGRVCAGLLTAYYADIFRGTVFPGILVLAGPGNNGADALVVLRSLILSGRAAAASSKVILSKAPPGAPGGPFPPGLISMGRASEGSPGAAAPEESPRGAALRTLIKMGVPVSLWGAPVGPSFQGPISAGRASEGAPVAPPPEESPYGAPGGALSGAWEFILDGIAGTGIGGPLRGVPAEMAAALNALTVHRGGVPGRRGGGPRVVSIDIPSGNFDGWEPGMPLVEADLTLGIEPLKACLYGPASRVYAGKILKAGGIFPRALIESYGGTELFGAELFGAELRGWEDAAAAIPRVRPDAYKHRRGIVEIHAGAPGTTGAARIAARGAQAVGAGLIRLVVDREIYPILASSAGGIMVAPLRGAFVGGGQLPDRPAPNEPPSGGPSEAGALALGPGWGRGPDRRETLEWALEWEAAGTPLVLDADAIHLAREKVFHGNAILTPHPGEFAAFLGIPQAELPADPAPLIRKTAAERRAVILYKSCVLIVAAEDGRLTYLDGLEPALAAGGSGDLLAGFCVGLAARTRAAGSFDGYACAAAAAALLLESLRRGGLAKKFIDPLELAEAAAKAAGEAWL